MFEVATLTHGKMLELPDEIASQFKPSERFIVWTEGDTIHLKRLTSALKTLDAAPDDAPVSLDEIDEIVHEVREKRHEKKAG